MDNDLVNAVKAALTAALTVLPDTLEPPGDPTDQSWDWCWDELSGDAQEEVKKVRRLIHQALARLEDGTFTPENPSQ